jgi:hypothetical protein
MEQGQQLGCALADVFRGLAVRLAHRLPTGAWLGDGLVRSGLVMTPDG